MNRMMCYLPRSGLVQFLLYDAIFLFKNPQKALPQNNNGLTSGSSLSQNRKTVSPFNSKKYPQIDIHPPKANKLILADNQAGEFLLSI